MPRVFTCPPVGELQRFFLGRTPEPEARDLERHLESCDRCRRAVRALPAESPPASATHAPTSGDAASHSGAAGDETVAPAPSSASPPAETVAGGPDPEHTSVGPAGPAAGDGAAAETYDFLAPAERPDEIGRLGPYRVLKVLGSGGMGVVFLAEDPHLQRPVALKALLPGLAGGAATRQRFLREARAAAAVKHDHVVTIYQVGEDRKAPFLAMEFLDGESLEERLGRERRADKAAPLPTGEVLRIGREVAEGLAAAHERGLIHRDVKPANLWLEGGRGRVKILDFGLARAAADAAALTQPGAVVGTPAYMAPEQTRGEDVDHRADLFSLGCVLYRMATGEAPFRGKNTLAILAAVGLDNPPPLRRVNPEIPAALSDLVMELLSKDPAGRPASARGAAERLASIEREWASARAPTLPGSGSSDRMEALAAAVAAAPDNRPRRRRPWLGAAAALAGLAALLTAGAVVYVQTDRGTIKIETADDDVKVIVEQGGKQVKVIDAKTGKDVALASGEYTLRLGDDRKDVVLAPDHITLKRGDTAVAVITRIDTPPTDVAKGGKPPQSPAAAPLDEVWMKAVAALPAEKQVEAVVAKLKERNPGFDGNVTPTIKDGAVTELQFATDHVSDLTPVRALGGLRLLLCEGSAPGQGQIADLTALKGMSLMKLACEWNQVSDLSPLRGMPLTYLSCGGTPVGDLSPLEGMSLQQLYCNGTQVSALAPLKGMPLIILSCCETAVTDLAPLNGMPLSNLNIRATKVRDLSPLHGVALSILNCSRTRVIDLTPLKGMPLTTLNCNETVVADLAPLKGMPLQAAEFQHARISDLSPLDGAPIHHLDVAVTNIRDLSPLKNMPLTYLVCSGTPVADLSPLHALSLTYLDCSGTQVADLAPLKGMPLKEVWFDLQSERDAELLRSIGTVQKINGMPTAEFWKEWNAKKR